MVEGMAEEKHLRGLYGARTLFDHFLKRDRAASEVAHSQHVLGRNAGLRHLRDAASRQPERFRQRLVPSRPSL